MIKNNKINNLDTDEIWVNDFTYEEFSKFREKVMRQYQEDPNKPIVIRINSYGGEVDQLSAMIATLKEVSNPIVTVAYGTSMSCGAILLSCGDIRWCDPLARIMVHEVSGGTGGNVHDINTDAVELKRLNKQFLGLLAKNCGIKGGYEAIRKIIKSKDGRDMYMTAEEALQFGIVDAIGVPRIDNIMTFDVGTIPLKNFNIKKKVKQKPIREKRGG